MRPGFWQIVIVGGLLLMFFAPQVIKIIRALAGEASGGKAGQGRASGAPPPPSKSVRCHKCGAKLPDGARFCPKCGCTQDIIDV